MKQFEIGKSYSMRIAGDHDCRWTYTVINRTAQMITITDGKEVKKCRINKKASEWCGTETIYPMGQYSMCPVLTAN